MLGNPGIPGEEQLQGKVLDLRNRHQVLDIPKKLDNLLLLVAKVVLLLLQPREVARLRVLGIAVRHTDRSATTCVRAPLLYRLSLFLAATR